MRSKKSKIGWQAPDGRFSLIGTFLYAITIACSFHTSKQTQFQADDASENPPSFNDRTTNAQKNYKEAIARIDAKRSALASEYQRAGGQAKKNEVNRIFGKLTADDQLITKWIFKSAIPTRTR
jgi:hypothetical protein